MIFTTNKKKILSLVFAALFWLALWQAASMYVDKVLLIPSVPTVLSRLFQLAREPHFWHVVFTSIVRILTGFLLGVVIGTILAVGTVFVKVLDILISPAVRIVSATPIVSFIILAIVWIKSYNIPVFITTLMVAPIAWSNITVGLKKTDKGLLEMAKVFRFGRIKTLAKIYLPQTVPYFMSALTASVGLAWKSGIAAEVLALPKSAIGTNMQQAKLYLETPDVFAWTIVVIILSMIFEKLLTAVIRRVFSER